MTNEYPVIGNYRVLSELARGSFGRVYLAQHTVLTNRTVAVKLMLNTPLNSQDEREQFLQEARFLELLHHPSILPILDVGIHEGLPYIVSEYATKGSLRHRLQEISPQLPPMSAALTILSQIGQALHHAHKLNIVHRDLKPENILFNARGDALLADFGLATTLSSASMKSATTAGTPRYMAPEQFQGTVSRESDQYALACIAYELFTGQPPFTAPDAVVLMFKHVTEQPVDPCQRNPDLPPYVGQAVLTALEKDRHKRHPDIRSFIAALHIPTDSRSYPAQVDVKPVQEPPLPSPQEPIIPSPGSVPLADMWFSNDPSENEVTFVRATPSLTGPLRLSQLDAQASIPTYRSIGRGREGERKPRISRRTLFSGIAAIGVLGASIVWLSNTQILHAFLQPAPTYTPPTLPVQPTGATSTSTSINGHSGQPTPTHTRPQNASPTSAPTSQGNTPVPPTKAVPPTPTPTHSATATPDPTATATPSPTPDPTATPSPTPGSTPTPTPTPTPSPTPEPSPTPTPSPVPSPTPTPVPSPTPTP